MLYNLIKHFGDQEFGVMTQCFNLAKIQNAGPAYFDNIILKVNSKLDGQNTIIDGKEFDKILPKGINRSRTMVLGIDVNHPAEDTDISVASAVGSFDSTLTRFIATVRTQSKRGYEIVEKLQEMMTELFLSFKKRNNVYPDHLIIFRDGVSNGQFSFVLDDEKNQIKQAIAETIGQTCKITMLVVQKGHNTRFVLTRQGMSPNNRPTFNVPPGTVVDNKVGEFNFATFYLNSHFSPLVSNCVN